MLLLALRRGEIETTWFIRQSWYVLVITFYSHWYVFVILFSSASLCKIKMSSTNESQDSLLWGYASSHHNTLICSVVLWFSLFRLWFISAILNCQTYYAIVLAQLASCSFRCILSLHWQSVHLHSVNSWPKRTKGSEGLTDKHTNRQTIKQQVQSQSRDRLKYG